MRLGRALKRSDGAVLFPEGAQIDDTALKQMSQRGVDFAFVAMPETRDAQAIARDLAASETRVGHIFRAGAVSADYQTEARADLQAALLAFRRAGAQ